MKTYSTNQNIRQLAALLPKFGIRHIVACPGSRNAPIVHTLANTDGLELHAVTDERSAGFVAIGLSDALGESVAVCCTSGSALLNLAPAVAEAHYRNVPLLIISGDRPQKWINQMDGQTLVQPNALAPNAPSFSLPENNPDSWHANRLINEALHLLSSSRRPVHINLPLDEPLFGFSSEPLPDARHIKVTRSADTDSLAPLIDEWSHAQRPMIVVGQMMPNEDLAMQLNWLASTGRCIVLAEHLSNMRGAKIIHNFDDVLLQHDDTSLQPDLLVYFGGHIVSKRLKHFLRRTPLTTNWHVAYNADFVDLFQNLTRRIELPIAPVLQLITDHTPSTDASFVDRWLSLSKASRTPLTEEEWNEPNAVGHVIRNLPHSSQLLLANSSSVRWAQHFALPHDMTVFCNRGVNGIEGSSSAAVGTALAHPERPTTLLTGDLSFFYDLNALWNKHLPSNLTIVMLNNGGGEIFNHLPGLENSEHVGEFIAAHHASQAKGWAADAHCNYIFVSNIAELTAALRQTYLQNNQTTIIEACFPI